MCQLLVVQEQLNIISNLLIGAQRILYESALRNRIKDTEIA